MDRVTWAISMLCDSLGPPLRPRDSRSCSAVVEVVPDFLDRGTVTPLHRTEFVAVRVRWVLAI